MAEYYENKFMHYFGQEIADPMGVNDMSKVTPEVIIGNMKALCDNKE
ncbi:MAG: hypothetical protein PUB52_02030 [Lachnospiraceae bacterium]|nr:hypothetical protein [Lachnospiraceae bacterium]